MTREIVGPGEEDESVIRDFLLGRTAEADRERLEERLLADPDFSELVSAIEEDLIDDYTAGLLFNDERHRFETCFLVTEERRRRVQFSAALARVRVEELKALPFGEAQKKSFATLGGRIFHSWVQMAAAAIVVLSLGTALWMNRSMSRALDELRNAQAQVITLEQSRETLIEEHRRQLAESEALARATSQTVPRQVIVRPTRTGPDARPVLVAVLSPGVLRDTSSSVPSLRVSPSTLLIELQLELAENTHPGYTASVHDASGNEIFRAGGLRARTTSGRILVSLQLPAAQLPQGDYSIRLWGKAVGELEELDRYYVRVLAD